MTPSTVMDFLLGVFITLQAVQISQCLEGTLQGRLPRPKYGLSGVYDGERSIYLHGGVPNGSFILADEVFKFDILTNKVSLAAKSQYGLYLGATGYDGEGSFYYLAGYRIYETYFASQASVYTYTPENLEPVRVGRLPDRLTGHATASDGLGNIYVVGGKGDTSDSLNLLKYDTKTNRVETLALLPTGYEINGVAAAWANGTLYAFGGSAINKPGGPIWKYEPSLGNVTVIAPMPELYYATAVTVGNFIYIVGGVTKDERENKLFLYRFNIENEELEELDVPNVQRKLSRAAVVYVESLSRIYIAGGVGDGISSASEEILSIQL